MDPVFLHSGGPKEAYSLQKRASVPVGTGTRRAQAIRPAPSTFSLVPFSAFVNIYGLYLLDNLGKPPG